MLISISVLGTLLLKIWFHTSSVTEFIFRIQQSWMAIFIVTNLLMVISYKTLHKIYKYFILPLAMEQFGEISAFTYYLAIFFLLGLIHYNTDTLFRFLVIFDMIDLLYLSFLLSFRVKYLTLHPRFQKFSFHRNLYILQSSCIVFYSLIYRQIYNYLQTAYNPFVMFIGFIILSSILFCSQSIIQHTFIFMNVSPIIQLATDVTLYLLLCALSLYYFIDHLLSGYIPIHFGMSGFYTFGKAFILLRDYYIEHNLIKKLRKEYKIPTEDEVKDEVCIICRQNLTSADSVKLDCMHIFHIECIEAWASMHSQCPICRRDFMSD